MQTNIAAPLQNWMVLATNTATRSFYLHCDNVVDTAALDRFYILEREMTARRRFLAPG